MALPLIPLGKPMTDYDRAKDILWLAYQALQNLAERSKDPQIDALALEVLDIRTRYIA